MRRAKDKQHPSDDPDHEADATKPDKSGNRGYQERECPKQEASAESDGPEHSPAPALQEQEPAQSLDGEIKRLQEQLLRLGADFDNFRKRTLRDKALVCESANRELMLELLPVLDHLHLAVNAAAEHNSDPAFGQGLQLIFDQLIAALTKFGLAPIDAEGIPFDPNLHEAINCLPSDEYPEDVIIAQSRRGYLLGKRLLRPAQVIVSSGPANSAPDENESENY